MGRYEGHGKKGRESWGSVAVSVPVLARGATEPGRALTRRLSFLFFGTSETRAPSRVACSGEKLSREGKGALFYC